MSEIQRLGRLAEHELQLTADAHARHRAECIEQAIALAKEGLRDEAYFKLMMVVAIDGVRKLVFGSVETATMDKRSDELRHPEN